MASHKRGQQQHQQHSRHDSRGRGNGGQFSSSGGSRDAGNDSRTWQSSGSGGGNDRGWGNEGEWSDDGEWPADGSTQQGSSAEGYRQGRYGQGEYRGDEDRPYFGSDQRLGGYGGQYGRSPQSYQWSSQGPHAGKGPKGYQRPDERIREDICDALTDHPEIDASDIEIDVKGGEVTITGSVDSREAKRMTEDVADQRSGVTHVSNQLRVQNGLRQSGSGTSSWSTTQGRGRSGSASGGRREAR